VTYFDKEESDKKMTIQNEKWGFYDNREMEMYNQPRIHSLLLLILQVRVFKNRYVWMDEWMDE